MPRISREKIDELIQTADIVDVISEFVSLQPSGKSMKGLCPFHSEKTPSFHVSQEKQLFNCFGCHKKGNVITFVEEYKHLDYMDAIHFLADKYHFDLGDTDYQVDRYNYKKLYEVNKLAKDFFNLNLLNLESGKQALTYLENRKIDQQTLNEFGIGYAPSKDNLLLKTLKENFQEFELAEAGLINRRDSGDYYDVFRDRIVFPITSEHGQVLGFSGRLLTDDKNQPKYVNTQATKIFNKGQILYNLDKALPYINQRKRLVLMEGFFDVIQASKAGVEESVCTMGTELTFDQVKKIKKYTDDVVICYDGDSAGQQATYRALQMLEKMNMNVQVALMPEGLDPDEYLKKFSATKFRNQLNQNLVDKFDFVYQMIIDKGLSTSSEIETAKNSLFKFLLSSASKTISMIYLQKFAEEIHLNSEVIEQDYQMYLVNQRRYQTVEKTIQTLPKKQTVSKSRIKAEETIINYYLQSDDFRDIVEEVSDTMSFVKGPRMNILLALRALYHAHKDVSLYTLKSDIDETHFNCLNDILFKDNYNYSDFELRQVLDSLILEKLKEEVSMLNEEIGSLILKNKEENDRKNLDLLSQLMREMNEKKQIVDKIYYRRKHNKPSV